MVMYIQSSQSSSLFLYYLEEPWLMLTAVCIYAARWLSAAVVYILLRVLVTHRSVAATHSDLW